MSTFQEKTRYRLLDAEQYDDEEFGTGYGYVETVAGGDGTYICDCWITDEDGNVHPGYSECPVPVRAQDVDLESAEPGVLGEREPSWGFKF